MPLKERAHCLYSPSWTLAINVHVPPNKLLRRSHCGQNLDRKRASVFHYTLLSICANLTWKRRYNCAFCDEQGSRKSARVVKQLNECQSCRNFKREQAGGRPPRPQPTGPTFCSRFVSVYLLFLYRQPSNYESTVL